MIIPPRLADQILRTHGTAGREWLERLPFLLTELKGRWGLEECEPFENLSYHFVARTIRRSEPVVLKFGVPNPEFDQEAVALTAFDGEGCVRLLEFEPEAAAMLLEDIRPGTPLAETWSEGVDEPHTERIAEAMLRLWRARDMEEHPTLDHWFRVFEEDQPLLAGDLLERAKSAMEELGRAMGETQLLHGDLHHGNLLQAGDGFKAIDPKGVVGDPGFEIYALLHNPVGVEVDVLSRLWKKRVRRVAEVTGIDEVRLQAWGFCGLVLSACWSAEEGGRADRTVELAREMAP